MSKILSLLFLFSLLFPITTQAQIKLRTVADWEAGSIVLLNGHKFVKLNGPGGDGYFMAMEPLCDIPDSDSIIIDQVGQGTDPTFTLSVSNATGIGPLCTWSATTSDGSPVTPNWTILPDANGRTTGCTIQIPTLDEETTFTPTVIGCNMTGDLSTDITVKTMPKISEITIAQIAAMPTCQDETNCPAEATIEAIDDRDGKQYTLRKLPDGKLWMVDNLAYGGSTLNGGTDYCLERNFLSNPDGSNTPSNNFGINTYGDCGNPAIGAMSSGFTRYCGPDQPLDGQCGYIYNWQAATQQQTAYMHRSYSGPTENLSGLCPDGFELPDVEDFRKLDYSFGGNGENAQNSPDLIAKYRNQKLFNAVMSGYSDASGFFTNQLSGGYWWSGNAYGDANAFQLAVHGNSNIYPYGNTNRDYGLAIRCLKDPTPKTTSEVTDEYIASMPSCTQDSCPADATLELTDPRDNKSYTFRKLPDGKLWMVDNLAYGGSTASGGSDYCANRQTITYPSSSSDASNNFGLGTYGDCVDPGYLPLSISPCKNGICGYLYTWQAAMQDSLAYEGGTLITQDDVTGLCPTGFTLPSNNDFENLDKAFGGSGGSDGSSQSSTTLTYRYINPNLFNGIFSGRTLSTGSTDGGQSGGGYWWSSTQYSSTRAYNLYLTNNNVSPQFNYNKGHGLAIRCLK